MIFLTDDGTGKERLRAQVKNAWNIKPMDLVRSACFWHQVTLALAAVLLLVAALWDARCYRIPNWFPLALLVLFPAYVLTSTQPVVWGQHVFVACLVLVAGFYLFTRKFIGAGDIKLLSAASLWAGPDRLGILLFVTTIAGGLLALATACVTLYRHRKAGGSGMALVAKAPIPYGVAIATGGLCALISLFHPFPLS